MSRLGEIGRMSKAEEGRSTEGADAIFASIRGHHHHRLQQQTAVICHHKARQRQTAIIEHHVKRHYRRTSTVLQSNPFHIDNRKQSDAIPDLRRARDHRFRDRLSGCGKRSRYHLYLANRRGNQISCEERRVEREVWECRWKWMDCRYGKR